MIITIGNTKGDSSKQKEPKSHAIFPEAFIPVA